MAVMVRDMLKQMGKTDKNVQMQIHPPKGPQKRIKKEGWKVLRLPLSFTYHLPIHSAFFQRPFVGHRTVRCLGCLFLLPFGLFPRCLLFPLGLGDS
jgi:hypothetical protein